MHTDKTAQSRYSTTFSVRRRLPPAAPLTSPLRAWLSVKISAAGACGPSRFFQSQPNSNGNRSRDHRLPRDSVVNVTQLLTLDRSFPTEHAGTLPPQMQGCIDEGFASSSATLAQRGFHPGLSARLFARDRDVASVGL